MPRRVLVTRSEQSFDLVEAPAPSEHHLQEVVKSSPQLLVLVEFKTGPQNPDFRHALAQAIDYGSDLLDRCLADRLFETAVSTHRPETVRAWAAIILAYLAQDDALELVARLIRLAPDLAQQDLVATLVDHLREWGWIDLF